jgi:hypothetical protein
MINFPKFNLNNISYYLFILFGLLTILIILFFWRRISELNNANNTLDKKISLLKKENKTLKEGNGTINNTDIDDTMKDIFDNINTNDELDIKIVKNNDKQKEFFEAPVENPVPLPVAQNFPEPTKVVKPVATPAQQMPSIIPKVPSHPPVPNVPPPQQMYNKDSSQVERQMPKVFPIIPEKLPNPVPPPAPQQVKPEPKIVELEQKNVGKTINLTTDINIDDIDNIEELASVVSDNNTTYTKSKLNRLNLDKIKEICAENNLSLEGTKNVLIDRILNANI